MSLPMPRRIKDMPPLVLPLDSAKDSEDENTPSKQNENTENKENAPTNRLNKKCFPKRTSELSPTVEYDESVDEHDSFNCAILNNSFILSPSKADSTPFKIPVDRKINNFEQSSSKDTGYWDAGDSMVTELKSIKLNSTKAASRAQSSSTDFDNLVFDQHESNPQSFQKFSFLESAKIKLLNDNESMFGLTAESKSLQEYPHKSLNPIKSVNENIILSKRPTTENLILARKTQPKLLKIFNASTHGQKVNEENETPFKLTCESLNKISDPNFITPQVKSLQVLSKSNRPNYMHSITQQKSRKFIEKELKSPKILFQTPYSSSRPPIVNDSISLSLDDTDKDKSTTLDSLTKIMRTSPASRNLLKSKKSCDILFKSKIEENSFQPNEDDVEDMKNKKTILINNKEYIILEKIGSGGSSSVFLSRQKGNKKKEEFALKIVDLRGEPTVVEGYLNETKLLAKLQGNINVVSLFEYEHRLKESILYMVMERGESDLQKILQSYQASDMPLYDLMNYWYQILQSVNYIHHNGVIHSDLKPPNFLMVNGRLKLIDFGIASNISFDATSIIKFSQAGTFNFISPEALIDTSTGESPMNKNQPKIKISTKSDVWSLGCILYLFIYKKTPFGHIKNIYKKASAISNPATSIEYPELPMYYPPMLLEMARKCLVHNPKKRISVSELLKYPFNKVIPIEKNGN